jgi:hypothetical protein
MIYGRRKAVTGHLERTTPDLRSLFPTNNRRSLNLEALMFTALCIGCLCVFVFGTAIRFGMLAGLLGRTGVLPENWRRWMYDTKSAKLQH